MKAIEPAVLSSRPRTKRFSPEPLAFMLPQ
jgi:hypothetical protein